MQRLDVWLEMWYNAYVSPSKRLAPSTKDMYRRSIAAVPAWLGSCDIADPLIVLQMVRWVSEVEAATPRAAQLDRVMLCRAMAIAGKLGLCPRGLLDADTLPKPEHHARETLVFSADEAKTYIFAARSSPWYPLLMLCLCGLRRGEALGARWQDLDGDTLHITRQRQRIHGRLEVRPLKSKSSTRSIVLPSWLLADLQRMPRSITGWILDTTPEQLRKAHLQVISSASLPPVTLHGLRHTFATLAAAQGLPMKHLQLALGHSKIALTADLYASHSYPPSALPALVFPCF